MVSWPSRSALSSVLSALNTTFAHHKQDTGNTTLPVIIWLGFLNNDALQVGDCLRDVQVDSLQVCYIEASPLPSPLKNTVEKFYKEWISNCLTEQAQKLFICVASSAAPQGSEQFAFLLMTTCQGKYFG